MDDLLGENTQFDVGFLGPPLEQLERGVCADPVDEHQHALGLFDAAPRLGDLGDRLTDDLLVGFVH